MTMPILTGCAFHQDLSRAKRHRCRQPGDHRRSRRAKFMTPSPSMHRISNGRRNANGGLLCAST
ncbi:hypothetical protein A0U89_15005 (plasmid) [Kozakia baliensis]|uniref:Uncharacterized protein n=1 Tax=Kozakia baliensis TaxID=153496 RepID=A0A1D8UY38_9PROT|nr:hypothetical protein A0U89_14900 [Kozakia baliensis]AOX18618.1 hypothetical protein A0U89_15005 [Kozakia baliensis]